MKNLIFYTGLLTENLFYLVDAELTRKKKIKKITLLI